jgi:integrin beta 3
VNGINGQDGAAGLNGKDGADGLGFDDADLVFAESTGYTLRLAQGERVKEWPIPIPFDAGVWQAGRTYPKGACVTRQGGLWTAQDATSARPGDEGAASRAWRLSVKGGKDGKPGPPGRDGTS